MSLEKDIFGFSDDEDQDLDDVFNIKDIDSGESCF